ncbi:glycosyltransferase (family 2) [Methanocella arvoryzae MRE50]|uniref:Glycosyltransferase (Family 2) n=2 Tax=Methanocella TaxID=570266 RepID=Q0W7F6_METAR|nr:glycosyltransferase (family 2) [Methanocella arvoryzae MRE50]
MHESPYISIIVPVLNEEGSVRELYGEIKTVLQELDVSYEIIFIDDGSTDSTKDILDEIKTVDNGLQVISLQKNYGKAAALSCGFTLAKGNIVITMDGDLQDDPKEIPRFIEALKQYDMVSGWKQKRQDPLTKTLPSSVFNLLTRWLTNVEIHDFNCGFKGYRSGVVKSINLYGELHRYIPALARIAGYKVGEISVNHRQRVHGKSKYGAKRIVRGFIDLITVKFLMSYSQKPLHFFGGIGSIFGITGCAVLTFLVYQWLNGIRIGDRPLLNLGILMIIIGMQFVAIGLIGELIVNLMPRKYWIIKHE